MLCLIQVAPPVRRPHVVFDVVFDFVCDRLLVVCLELVDVFVVFFAHPSTSAGEYSARYPPAGKDAEKYHPHFGWQATPQDHRRQKEYCNRFIGIGKRLQYFFGLQSWVSVLGEASRVALGKVFGITSFSAAPRSWPAQPRSTLGCCELVLVAAGGARRRSLYQKSYLGQRETLFPLADGVVGREGGEGGGQGAHPSACAAEYSAQYRQPPPPSRQRCRKNIIPIFGGR